MEEPVALVTGANSGIGAGVTRVLSRAGCQVVGTYFSHDERARELAEDLNRSGGNVHMVYADFSDPHTDFDALVVQVLARHGDLTWLVNCAAEARSIPLAEVTVVDFDRTMAVNLRAPLFLSRAAFRARQEGQCGLTAIVNVSSTSERFVAPGLSLYEAGKAALSMMTRSLGVEFAPLGVRVNAVCPGAIEVERSRADPGWDRGAVALVVPMGRVGDPEDVAEVIRFLLSDAACYVTGQVVYVDGGLSLRLQTASLSPGRVV